MLILTYLMTLGSVVTPPASFDAGKVVSYVEDPAVDEASGLAASQKHPGILYTFNDSGGKPRVFAIDSITGKTVANLRLQNADNCDWEDIGVGPGPDGKSYIYVGDIGGNSKRTCNVIYRFEEPNAIHDADIQVQSKARFRWSSLNSETMFIDPKGQVYLVSKVKPGQTPLLHPVPSWAWHTRRRVSLWAAYKVNLPRIEREGPVAGDLSKDGTELLLKMYNHMYYWKFRTHESVREALGRFPDKEVPYHKEPQGEAVCWNAESTGYYTLSEGAKQPIWLYSKLTATSGNTNNK